MSTLQKRTLPKNIVDPKVVIATLMENGFGNEKLMGVSLVGNGMQPVADFKNFFDAKLANTTSFNKRLAGTAKSVHEPRSA